MKEFIIDPNTARISPLNNNKDTLGVFHDNKTSGAHFSMSGPIVKQLSTFGAHINFMGSEQENVDQYTVTDLTITGDTMEFTWVLDRRATSEPGKILFICCFMKTDGSEWNTTVYADNILEGLEPTLTPEEEEEVQTYYETLIAGLDAKRDEVLQSLPSDYSKAVIRMNSLGELDSVAVQTMLHNTFL